MQQITEFLEAVKKGNTSIVEQMIISDPDIVNARAPSGESAIILALYYGQEDIAATLVQRGVRLDVFEASCLGDMSRVKSLVEEHPALVHSYSFDGFTPLHLAAFFGQANVAKFLISKGADLNVISKNTTFAEHNTPLDSTIASSSPNAVAVARLLIESGADPNALSHGDVAPLHEAVAQSDRGMVELLLSHGADINVRKRDGTTPLAIANEKNNKEMAELLRKHGAVRNLQGMICSWLFAVRVPIPLLARKHSRARVSLRQRRQIAEQLGSKLVGLGEFPSIWILMSRHTRVLNWLVRH